MEFLEKAPEKMRRNSETRTENPWSWRVCPHACGWIPTKLRLASDSDCVSKKNKENLRLLRCGGIYKILKLKIEDYATLKNSYLLHMPF